MQKRKVTAMNDELEFGTTRQVAASPATVLEAFANPRRLARWWGPKGFRNTFVECDFRSGGAWRFVMHAPAGGDFRNESRFVEVGPERVVIDHLSGPRFRLTITLDERERGTAIGWRMRFPTAEECARVKVFAVGANEENLDRLEAELA